MSATPHPLDLNVELVEQLLVRFLRGLEVLSDELCDDFVVRQLGAQGAKQVEVIHRLRSRNDCATTMKHAMRDTVMTLPRTLVVLAADATQGDQH